MGRHSPMADVRLIWPHLANDAHLTGDHLESQVALKHQNIQQCYQLRSIAQYRFNKVVFWVHAQVHDYSRGFDLLLLLPDGSFGTNSGCVIFSCWTLYIQTIIFFAFLDRLLGIAYYPVASATSAV